MTFTNDRPGGARSHASAAPQPTDTMPRLLSAEDLAELFALSVAEIEVAAAPANVPDMDPPGSLYSRESARVAISGQLITALWAEQSNRNAWVFLQSSGWKRLDPLTDTGSTALTLLAAHARATGSAPYADENLAGTLNTLYVW
ncbi:hypothetical protein GY21_06150 [Cryobacterium roopkundense]|uniref:Uncharacterized protein n=1 Tax=Cryobacterium roopkundense TaxID=1001240 RepID=A0A099JNE8_9MICO|nr:hypothetical protein [Cryobacterium roopkundense]KGJ79107.1 hypothetical protein GY21_06150 [Cryobacterium roopkundense]MBB5643275.1 hypothetical protein [Cryobacterium roopkundense]